MKFAHVLSTIASCELPQNMIFVDTETTEEGTADFKTHKLRLGWACRVVFHWGGKVPCETWQEFTTTNGFWEWLDRGVYEKEKHYLYAHNTHFDFFVLDGLNELKRLGWTLKSWFVTSTIFLMKFKKKDKTLMVLDSGNILKAPLRDIGKKVGLEKLGVDFNAVTETELSIYCKRDVEILKRWILSYGGF